MSGLIGSPVWGQPVRTMVEFRRENVVLQEWDLSCGAAALATVLRFQHGDPISEREVALGLMQREDYLADPDLLRLRQGFSLLDLKRYSEGRGYVGVGMGGMEIADLVAGAPVIVPVNLLGYNHFVVFRGVHGNRVLLADPAYGNRTLTLDRFKAAWIDYPEMGRVGFMVQRQDGQTGPGALRPRADEFLSLR